ncbi:hypothetical protein [Neptunomonas sp. XY-337]|uniref:hypothetical protein n=1 Tax=Neptunomonas sp. XY-337 TaxID=2561897 RepID=UPI0010A9D3E8|nr:hypothetical protein [Neptunomonas sp. XY-337]
MKKDHNKCIHLTKPENDQLKRASELTDRSMSQILHDCFVVALKKPGGLEQRLAEERLTQARELVTDSNHPMASMDFFSTERSQDTHDDARFSRLFAEARRPDTLHG